VRPAPPSPRQPQALTARAAAYYNNHYWARVAGISLQEINALEVEFLQCIDYRLMVQPEAFDIVVRSFAVGLRL
jgi:hypothetical protein